MRRGSATPPCWWTLGRSPESSRSPAPGTATTGRRSGRGARTRSCTCATTRRSLPRSRRRGKLCWASLRIRPVPPRWRGPSRRSRVRGWGALAPDMRGWVFPLADNIGGGGRVEGGERGARGGAPGKAGGGESPVGGELLGFFLFIEQNYLFWRGVSPAPPRISLFGVLHPRK